MRRKISIFALILGVFLVFTGCNNKDKENISENINDKIKIGVTIYPLKDFAESIGGDKVEVFSIIPDGTDAHSFDPKPTDLKNLTNSNIFIYNGLGMEEWINSILTTLEGTEVKIVEASSGIKALTAVKEEDLEDHEEEEHDEEEHSHGDYDPHVWLSLTDAVKEVENIKNALIEIDAENKEYYEANYDKLISKMNALKDTYIEKFKNIENKDLVTGHAAFAYIARDFGLIQNSIADVYGEGELTPKDLEKLIDYCKENKVKVIFSETTASAEASETLANAVGAAIEKIYSLETKEDDLDYLQAMEYNLETIYTSLLK
ncbi:metal ABC transporter solute-binding protein, Zn/Mn family [Clostridium isatidis]|uniref:ABC transporter substrate-binding protein n=1 Tax=Clostridium isatidis TaxID=182773 RepID=A0A343JER2_9CLOT|nr:zinc ABC transporter substrate-binding protein [Clostridium isatidis]ASW44020.1 ABC transporter substrate-binding protein [Clostridium isatidis]NLZ35326.1 zinc ABC transporter solute-binding protein [Clostridiales bacterium]